MQDAQREEPRCQFSHLRSVHWKKRTSGGCRNGKSWAMMINPSGSIQRPRIGRNRENPAGDQQHADKDADDEHRRLPQPVQEARQPVRQMLLDAVEIAFEFGSGYGVAQG